MYFRSIVLLSSLLCISVQSMDPNKPLYLTLENNTTLSFPSYVIQYFPTLQDLLGDIDPEGTLLNPNHGILIPNCSQKTLTFLMQLAQAIHSRQDLGKFFEWIIDFSKQELDELNKLINFLNATAIINSTFIKLIAHRNRQLQAVANKANTITIIIKDRPFTIPMNVIKYMKTLQNMIGATEATELSNLRFPDNSPLGSTNPEVFDALVKIITVYDEMKSKDEEALFDLNLVIKPLLNGHKKSLVPLLVNLLNIINFLDVEILYQRMVTLVVTYLQNNSLNANDPAWNNLNLDSIQLIKEMLINPLLHDLTMVAIQENKPETILPLGHNGERPSFSQNGLFACTTNKTQTNISIIDLEKGLITLTHELNFKLEDFYMHRDGSTVIIHRANPDALYLFDIPNKQLTLTGCTLPVGQTIQTFMLSPDKKKLCIITNQNLILTFGGTNFAQEIGRTSFAPDTPHTYMISWFPNSLKFAVTATYEERGIGVLLMVGSIDNKFNISRGIKGMRDRPFVVAPLSDTDLLCMHPHTDPYILHFNEAGDSTTPISKPNIYWPHRIESPYQIVLSNTGNYILMFGGGYIDIIEVATGYIIKTFQPPFPANFNHNDTGLWAYDQKAVSITFYSFKHAQSGNIETILYNLNLAQLKLITDIIVAIKNKGRTFTGFTEQERKLLRQHQVLPQKDVMLAISSEKVALLESVLIALQAVYTEIFSLESDESEEMEEDDDNAQEDLMDVDEEQ